MLSFGVLETKRVASPRNRGVPLPVTTQHFIMLIKWKFFFLGIPKVPFVAKLLDNIPPDNLNHGWLRIDTVLEKRLQLLVNTAAPSAIHRYMAWCFSGISNDGPQGLDVSVNGGVFCF